MSRWLPALVAIAAANSPAAAQLPPDKALASMKTADGLQVELFAAEPMVLNPTSMDVDHRGRVWVCEAVNYRRLPPYNRPILRPEGDRIVILTDTNGDGKADESSVFYQGKDLYGPLGIAVAKDAAGPAYKVFVCQSPDILLFHDKDGDGKADGPPEKFLSGFGGIDHDHGVHGILIGPDGKLYFTVGDSGVTGLQSKDGKGKKWVTTRDPKGDCQAGTVWRCDFDGTNLELIAHNFRNNYEPCVDSFGEIWLSDNDDDGNQQTRICHVMPGGNYGYWPRGPGQTHWHEEQPGVVHKTLRTGFGSPTGICFYEGSLLPAKYRGHLLHADAGPREVRAFHRTPKGAGYELEKTVVLTSPDNWFRPSDVCVGPDGSVFVADWYDPGVGGHGMGDWKMGRVYRVTPKGHAEYKVPAVKLDTKEGVLAALGSPCLATRAQAHSSLNTMQAFEAKSAVLPGLESNDDHLLARALWIFYGDAHKPPPGERSYGAIKPSESILDHLDKKRRLPTFAAQTIRFDSYPRGIDIRMIGKWWIDDLKAAPIAAKREFLLECRKATKIEDVKRAFYLLAELYDGKDHFYRAALNIACGTDPARRDAILADFDKHFPEWNDTVADLVWELRPKSVLPRLEKLLADGKLTAAQKGRIVDILAANDDPAVGKTLLALLKSDHPAEVKARAVENLRLFLPTKWIAVAGDEDVKATVRDLLKDPKSAATGLQLAPAVGAATTDDVVTIAADGPKELRAEAVRTLGRIRHDAAIRALIKLAQSDAALAVECVTALAPQLPTTQVYPHAKGEALKYLQDLVTSKTAGRELRSAALAALAGNRHGSSALLYWKEKNELPEDLVAEAGRLLRNSPMQGVRNKAMLLFPAAGKLDLKKLPPPAELAKRTGNADNGKAIMARSFTSEVQCLKCHMVRGTGGQIGPDLSMIGKKASREDLFKSVLQPSAAIADQSASWKIDTADGQSIVGLVVGETASVVTVRDANGKDHQIEVSEVAKRTKSLVSLMPDNLAAALTEDELIDLVEYMTTLQTPSLSPESFWLAGPFDSPGGNDGLDTAFAPEKEKFDPAAAFDTKSGKVGWRKVRPDAKGYVDLAALHGTAGNRSVSYLYLEVESPADQAAEVLLGTDDGATLTVNGEVRHTEKATRAAAPEQARVAVKLKKGSNALLLKVANGNNPHGAYLTITGVPDLKAK